MAARSPDNLSLTRSRRGRRLVLAVATAGLAIALGAPSASATFPGTNGRIALNAFVEKTDSVEIFTATPDGGDLQQLTSNPKEFSELPDWSPDGQRIAFQSGRGNRSQIYSMNADGSDVTQLTKGRGFHITPAWSPDGASLAIGSEWGDYPAQQGIWIIPASDPGGATQQEARRLTTLPADFRNDEEPQFSPDGSSIVFTRFKNDRRSAIHRVGIDGTGLERLTPWKLNASDPDWSPDGQTITFDSGDFNGQTGGGGDIYVMRADGSGRTKLTDYPRQEKFPPKRPGLANNPVWSPSGDQIMFSHFVPNAIKLVAMNPDGSGRREVVGGRFGKRNFPNKVDWGTHP